jgi:hypothetical protein
MTDNHAPTRAAAPADVAAALQAVLTEQGIMPDGFAAEFTRHAEEQWVTQNGSQMAHWCW